MAIDFQSNISYDNLQRAYVITMFAMWGIGVDIPRLLVRYARSYPMVINIHSISMLIIGLMTLMYVTALTVTFYTQSFVLGKRLTGIPLAAFVLAWILCFCVLVQFALGFKLRYEMVTNRLSTDMFSLKRVHRVVGTTMSILGKVIVALQLQTILTNDRVLFKAWLFLIGALLLVFVMFEIVYRIQTRSIMFKFPLKHISKFEKHHLQILDNLNSNRDAFPDYKELGVRYIILDNVMYYIDQNFIHPGGEHIFNIYNGQEVNYLFRGTHQPSPDFPRHNHTKYAFNYLEQREVGRIHVESILLNRNQSSEDIVEWKMTALQEMEGDSYLIQFEAGDAYVRQMLSVENFGKYMMIGCPSQEIIGKERRPYSLIISLGNLQQSISKRFKQAYFTSCHSEGSSSSLMRKKIEQSSYDANERRSALTFCIKRYKHGLFTKFMFSSQTERKFKIQGPYGRGLRLKPMSKGFYIIIAAGTGITPFVDLFHFLFLKTLLKLIKRKQGDRSAQKLNLEGVDYSMLDDVKILFIGSFASSKHFYQSNIVKDLYHLNRKHELNQFDMQLRYNNGESEPDVYMIRQFFDKKFIEELLKRQPDRIYFCGPPSIQEVIRKVEAQRNIKNKFFFL